MTGCAKDNAFFEDIPAMLNAGKIKVMPSSASCVRAKAQEDWQNINDALQNAGPGELVQLEEGLFYLHRSIVRWDFSGALRGAGISKTSIQTAPEIQFDVNDCPPLNWSFESNDVFNTLFFPPF